MVAVQYFVHFIVDKCIAIGKVTICKTAIKAGSHIPFVWRIQQRGIVLTLKTQSKKENNGTKYFFNHSKSQIYYNYLFGKILQTFSLIISKSKDWTEVKLCYLYGIIFKYFYICGQIIFKCLILKSITQLIQSIFRSKIRDAHLCCHGISMAII